MLKRFSSHSLGDRIRAMVALIALLGSVWLLGSHLSAELVDASSPDVQSSIPNNYLFRNPGGKAATFSNQGSVDLTGEYFQAQGTNGRSCASCHIAEEAWSINPGTLQHLFDETQGTHPIFNPLDANNPSAIPLNPTVEDLLAAYSMLLSRGVFRRGGIPRANSEWELIAVEDPHGYANLNRLVHWRRAMPTINFALGSATVNWDGGNSIGTDQHAGLVNQATRNVTGGQQGPPAPPEVIAEIVALEESLFSAITSGGAGGPCWPPVTLRVA